MFRSIFLFMQNTITNDNVMILAQAQALESAPVQSVETVSAEAPVSAPENAAPQGGLGGGGWSSLLIWVLLFAGLWFLLFMPQRKRQKALQKLQNELKSGDTVYTTSGIVGKIVSLDETTVTLQVSEGTRIPFLRNAVVGHAAEKSK